MRPVPYSASDRCIEILKSKRYFGTRVAAVGAIFALAAALLACAAKPAVATDASRKKARYYYSAGIVEQAQGHEDRAYEYFRKAYDADPGYVEAASAYGTRRLSIGIDTLQSDFEISRSLGMMRSYIDKYPEDLYESQYYGFAVKPARLSRRGSRDSGTRIYVPPGDYRHIDTALRRLRPSGRYGEGCRVD